MEYVLLFVIVEMMCLRWLRRFVSACQTIRIDAPSVRVVNVREDVGSYPGKEFFGGCLHCFWPLFCHSNLLYGLDWSDFFLFSAKSP